MKNKRLIALIAGVACLAILVAALIWSLTRRSPDPAGTGEDPTQSSGQTDGNNQPEENPPAGTEPDTPAEPNSSDPPETTIDPPETTVDPPETTIDPPETTNSSDNSGKEETSSSGGTSSAGKLNPNPTTKAEIEAVLNDPFMLLVNRDHKVSSDYKGFDLVTYSGEYKLNSTCTAALRQLISAGKKAGYNYTLYSAYRSYSSQYNKYYNKIAYWEGEGYSHEEAVRLTDEYYAPPGASEHHTGLAADVCIPEIVNKYACLHENYDQTEAFRWFSSHAHEYGFILRYPKGAEAITGYNYEPWHYRYVGVEIATEIYRRGITLEEYVADLEARLAALG